MGSPDQKESSQRDGSFCVSGATGSRSLVESCEDEFTSPKNFNKGTGPVRIDSPWGHISISTPRATIVSMKNNRVLAYILFAIGIVLTISTQGLIESVSYIKITAILSIVSLGVSMFYASKTVDGVKLSSIIIKIISICATLAIMFDLLLISGFGIGH